MINNKHLCRGGMILAATAEIITPYDFQFAGSETHKTHSGDISHPVEHLQKAQVFILNNKHFYVGGIILASTAEIITPL